MVALLVIGASQWKYASSYAKEFPGVDLRVISRSGMTVNEVDEWMIKATESCNRVVLHLGTNNLIGGKSRFFLFCLTICGAKLKRLSKKNCFDVLIFKSVNCQCFAF